MIDKKVSPKGKSVRVTFSLPADVAGDSAAVVGSFNDWTPAPMKLDAKNGVWKKGVSMKPGEVVEFRYLVDGEQWLNDEEADRFVSNEYFGENGVLEL